MDVGYYIGELLREFGKVSVPGLGVFANTRINARYDDKDGTMYPPRCLVQFDPQQVNDDTMAGYLADKKNISLASARYFIEKYVSSIVLGAATGETPLADIGWFYADEATLMFRPAEQTKTDTDFFGYVPLQLKKKQAVPAVQDPDQQLQITQAAYTEPQVIKPGVPRYPSEYRESYYSRRRKKGRDNTLAFILIGLLFIAGIVFLIYIYDPSSFSTVTVLKSKNPVADEPGTKELPADTSRSSMFKDTLVKIPRVAGIAIKDSIPYPHFELMGGSFSDSAEAVKAIGNYKKLGIAARIVKVVPLKRVNVSIGTYKTRGEAYAARRDMIKTKKIKSDIYPLEVKKKL